jgi:hypothetical protein
MRPPVPSGLQRVSPKGGAAIQGHYIPENVSPRHSKAYYRPRSVHRYMSFKIILINNFARPEQFIPERWINQKLHYSFQLIHLHCFLSRRQTMFWQKVHPPTSSPLTVSLAFLELRLVLAHFAYLFDTTCPGTDPGYCYTVVIHPNLVHIILVPPHLRIWRLDSFMEYFSNAGIIISLVALVMEIL